MSEPSLDRTRLSGHQGHHSCALRKTGTEARKPGRSAHCDRQSPGMDQRHQARPHSGTSRSGPRFFGVRSGGEPAPSLDMAEVSQRSATGSRSGDRINPDKTGWPSLSDARHDRAIGITRRSAHRERAGVPGSQSPLVLRHTRLTVSLPPRRRTAPPVHAAPGACWSRTDKRR